MAKYYGKIGYAVTTEVRPGVWGPEEIIEKPAFGDVEQRSIRHQQSDKVTEDLTTSDEISIIMDAFAKDNFSNIRYVNYLGANWKVVNARVRYPRIVLTLGGVYNGRTITSNGHSPS